MINRFSSRRQPLDSSFLNERLKGALAYDRVAGYFSSSIMEVAGEALESMQGKVRIVCNSELDERDVITAQAANMAMRREWCSWKPEKWGEAAKPRFQRLHDFLRDGRMEVRVLPTKKFGLIHGKAGVVTLADGTKTSFIGSANETQNAWQLNYELVWEDASVEAVTWVQEEFDALWALGIPLAEFVIEDAGRLAHRKIVPSVESWREDPNQASPIIELPVYRQEYGLWEHQKFFVQMAFDAHRGPHGARLVLADQVGLGKTLQLALSAMLMVLQGGGPGLIIVPKTLMWQWQDELRDLLDMPTAVWNGKQWVDEQGIEYPAIGPEGVRKCPRRIGIISQGQITAGTQATEFVKKMNWEVVIIDESHRARRRNLGEDREGEKPDPNNLLQFLYDIAGNTKSLLLATATPVQMYPVEAWDLLSALGYGEESVLGNMWSEWRKAERCLPVVQGREDLPEDDRELWEWVRNPLPPATSRIEDRDFVEIRRALKAKDKQAVVSGDAWEKLTPPTRDRVRRLRKSFGTHHSPFIRHIVRRTREYLEKTINPETNEPFLKPVKVQLFGEEDAEAILLPSYLKDAYGHAEEFCGLLKQRMGGAGFLKTMLLRRVGSTIEAGRLTAEKMLGTWEDIDEVDYEEEVGKAEEEALKSLTPSERKLLQAFVDALRAFPGEDPKYAVVKRLLLEGQGATGPWLEQGCIVFSAYFDSIIWLAKKLSAEDIPEEPIGIYAGSGRSAIMKGGLLQREEREELKRMVRRGELRLILGTDAASEGLNLQRLGTLINLDLPWNPTRLEQRKGRIQRIGQVRDTVYVYNMRYKDSVEDRVHQLLSSRLQEIFRLFGQVPDVLEDVWVQVAEGEVEKAKKIIAAVPKKHAFDERYQKPEPVPWESCAAVLNAVDRRAFLQQGWDSRRR
ncbi:MAG: hypothetical protein PWP23_2259 [Candidatus Sumerlaeota bacterium]|nr:hypothetical protein [Candidatus Sumerlaeota bacterium]